jgi:hypothetical protein
MTAPGIRYITSGRKADIGLRRVNVRFRGKADMVIARRNVRL